MKNFNFYYIKENILEKGMRELKRPLAFLLSICMIVLMTPLLPYDLGIIEEAHAVEVAALPFSGSTCTISEDTVLTAPQTIGADVTITIQEGKTLTLDRDLILNGSVTINGSGTIVVGSDSASSLIDIYGNATISGIIISGRTSNKPLIAAHSSDPQTIILDSVIIEGANVQTANAPSVFVFSNPARAHSLYLRGTTTITGNRGGDVGAIGCPGGVDGDATIYVQDSVKIHNNYSSTAEANICGLNIQVSDDLTSSARIGVTPKDYSSAFAILDGTVAYPVVARDAFFMDDFHNYGVDISGSTLVPIAKSEMDVTFTGGLGSVTAKDAKGNNIVSTSNPALGVATVKEVAGRTVNMHLDPKDSTYFVKNVTVGGVNALANLLPYDADTYKKALTFAAINGDIDVIFEKAITSVDIGDVIQPYGFLESGDSLVNAAITDSDPDTASIAITNIAWLKTGDVEMTSTETFTEGSSYKLSITLTASGGSKFAPDVAIAVAGVNATGHTDGVDDTTLTVTKTIAAAKMPLSVAIATNYVTFSAIASNTVYDGQYHGPVITMRDYKGGLFDAANSSISGYTATDPYPCFGTITSNAGNDGRAYIDYTIPVEGARNAATYENIEVLVANSRYDGTWSAGNLEHTIFQKTITPVAIDISNANKIYDGTNVVTGGDITFEGLVGTETLRSDRHYMADFAFDSPNAGSRTVIASNVQLTGSALVNYKIDTPTVSQTGATIYKATPGPREGSLVVTPPVDSTGVHISDINLTISPIAKFMNTHTQSGDVEGTLNLIEDKDGNALVGTEEIHKNEFFKWLFEPTGADAVNYTSASGMIALWPVQPIKTITLGGISVPNPGDVHVTTSGAISVTAVGPTAGSGIVIDSVTWTETNPNTSTTTAINEGYTYKHHRTYTMEIVVRPATGDIFTTDGSLAMSFVTGGATYTMTRVSSNSSTATFRYVTETALGAMPSNPFDAQSNNGQTFTYDGQMHYCTFGSINALLDDGFLEYRTQAGGQYSAWTRINSDAGLTGYKDANSSATENWTFNIQIKHPDFTGTASDSYDIHINPKTITPYVTSVAQKPYDNTADVTATVSSSEVVQGDIVTFTVVGATISNKNYTTGNVVVTASGIAISGTSASNYALSSTDAVTSGALNIIQKVTPTGGSITFTEVSTPNTDYTELFTTYGLAPVGFTNTNITVGSNVVDGDIVLYGDENFVVPLSGTAGNNIIQKRRPYYWKFVPSGAAAVNYNEVTGSATFWPGAPITNVTFTGITLPVAGNTPTARTSVAKTFNDVSANNTITIEDIAWYETAPNPEDATYDAAHANVTERALSVSDTFYYNRHHALVVTLSAVGTEDEFNNDLNMGPIFSGKVQIGTDIYPCTTEFINMGTAADPEWTKVVLTCTFGGLLTDMGALAPANLQYQDFASYKSTDGGVTLTDMIDGIRGEDDIVNGYRLAYVFTGKWVGPNPKTASLQDDDLAKFSYSVNGGSYTTTAPRYRNVMNPAVVAINIKLEHPDYTGSVNKDVEFQIAPCKVRPVGVEYSGKYYDGTTAISGAKLIWLPQGSQGTGGNIQFEGATAEEIARNIEYTANYEFDGSNCGAAKDVLVTGIDGTSDNFICVVEDVSASYPNFDYHSQSSFTAKNCAPIRQATVKPKNGTILTKSIGSAVSLSAITADYILTTHDESTSSAATRMVNVNNTTLDAYGTLGFDNAAGTGFMTADELDAVKIVQGQAYTWRFEPSPLHPLHSLNYKTTTGSQILWPVPQNPGGGGGGGGGGGAVVVTPTSSAIKDGIVVENKTKDDERIHVYKGVNGKIVMDEDYRVNNNGEAVTKALAKTPDANVAVSTNGDVVVKAIVESGALKAYMRGEYYLTLQKRDTDYIDMDRHWSKKYVDFCSNRNLVNGVGEGKFDPDGTLTRGMAATIFYRLESSPSITSSARWFADVERGEWYSNGIAWAGGCGVVNGIGIKNFAPHWAITREQMAVMIYNYCVKFCGVGDVANASSVRTRYYDGTSISDWAEKAVAFCYNTGLMTGDEDGNFCPQLSATRAEFSTIMERLIRAIVENTL